jgi:hypothetical protein
MFRSYQKVCALTFALFLTGICWSAELPHPPTASALALRRLARQSGYIFAGTVTAVESRASASSVPSTKITFHVDQAIRGVRKGQTLVIHEWAGVLQDGESYRRGDRVLLFLYRPSKLGLTSPVGGQQGRFKLDSIGTAILRREQMTDWLPKVTSPSGSLGSTPISVTDFARAIHQAEEE